MKSKLLILALATVSVVSCQTDGPLNFDNDPEGVHINATVGEAFTRSNPAEDSKNTLFNAGDAVKVSAEKEAGVVYTFSGSTWSPSLDAYLKWANSEMIFTAVYPATVSPTDFTLPFDQSDASKIATADYMTYSGRIARNGSNPIAIPLSRKTARVVVEIQSFDDYYGDAQKTVNNLKISSLASGYSNSAVSGGVIQITPLAKGSGKVGSTYTALVIPTGVKNTSVNFVELTDGDEKISTVKEVPVMEAGNSYHVGVRVNKDGLSITSVIVTDWGTGTLIPDGETDLFVEYVDIPKGSFIMGSPIKGVSNATTTEPNRRDDEVQHEVALTGFQMSRYEITNYQYCLFLNSNKIDETGKWKDAKEYKDKVLIYDSSKNVLSPFGLYWDKDSKKWVPCLGYSNNPVVYVTWYGAKEFANWVDGDLPTEAQWEYAARGNYNDKATLNATLPFGIGTRKVLDGKMANIKGTKPYDLDMGGEQSDLNGIYLECTTRVGCYKSNNYGLYDMEGNVLEWCSDWYAEYDTKSGVITDPKGPPTGSNRVGRGGTYQFPAQYCRSACRFSALPDLYDGNTGFRVVVNSSNQK